MLFVAFVSAVLALSAPAVQGQVFSWGRCPKVPVAKNFQLDRWMGTWVEIARFPNRVESEMRCITEAKKIKPDGEVKWHKGNWDGSSINLETALSGVVIPKEPAKFSVPYFGLSFMPEVPYWVLEIDHDPQTGYYVGYTCFDFWLGNMQLLWILSRERQMDEGKLKGIVGRLEGHGVDTSKLQYAKWDPDCPKVP